MAIQSYQSPKKPSSVVQGGNSNHVGILSPVGDLTAAKSVGENCIIACFNSTNQVQFIRTGDNTVTIGTSYVDNIPVPPDSYIYINTGGYRFIIGSSGMYGYKLMDESAPSYE
jgi:hypothetical protein